MQFTSQPRANGLFSGLSAFVAFLALSFGGGLLVNHSMTRVDSGDWTLNLWGFGKESESTPGGSVNGVGARRNVEAPGQATSTILARGLESVRSYFSESEPEEPSGSGMVVQVGAFEDRMVAEQIRQDISSLTHRAVLLTSVQMGSGTFYRVRIRVGSEAEANSLAGFLKRERGLDPWILRQSPMP